MAANYPTRALMSYLPKRYPATAQQQEDRNEVYRFKNGNYSIRVLNGLESEINSIAGNDKGSYLICFIPASTSERTQLRYSGLASRLRSDTGCSATLSAVVNAFNRQSTIITGKTEDPTASFRVNASLVRGKKIILIDDVITRGRSFNGCAAMLLAAGATSVTGLFVAQTVNPDYRGYGAGCDFDPEDFFQDEFDPEDCDPDFYDEPDFDDFYDEPDPGDCYY